MSKRRALWSVLVMAIGMSGSASCVWALGLDGYHKHADGGADVPCEVDGQCDDMNACTADSCVDGFCAHAAAPEGDAAAQKPGDCKKIVCAAGVETTVPDDADVEDDDNDCTSDTCDAGTPAHGKAAAGTACTFAGQMGVCDDSATCKISCGMPSTPPCDDKNPCTDDPCNLTTHQCDFTPIPDGSPTPGVAQIDHDCKRRQCIGGKDTDAPDDTDLPTAPSDCVTPTCSGGLGSLPPKAVGAGCLTNGGQVCDGNGTCVLCNVDGDCSGKADDCRHPSCAAHTCGVTNTPVDTPTSTQTPGDCVTVVCDGMGGTKNNNNDQDTKDDGNPCTDDVCVNGTLTHPNKAMGVSCGGLLVCNGSGSCVGCVTDMDCQAGKQCNPPGCGMPNVCACCPKTCADLALTCGIASDGCGGMVQCNDGKTDNNETDVDCGGPSCSVKCTQGKHCNTTSDCVNGLTCVDGVCCNTPCNGACLACTAAKKGSGSDGVCGAVKLGTDPDNECPSQSQMTCGLTGVCDGAGACAKWDPGTICQAASCKSSTVLQNKDTCNNNGMCVDGGTTSCGHYICDPSALPVACKTSCANNADCASKYGCQVASGTCLLLSGQPCSADADCLSGKCSGAQKTCQ